MDVLISDGAIYVHTCETLGGEHDLKAYTVEEAAALAFRILRAATTLKATRAARAARPPGEVD